MKIECAWCGKDMGEKDGEGIEGVSHSVCEKCYKKLTPDAKKSLGQQTAINNIKPRFRKRFSKRNDS